MNLVRVSVVASCFSLLACKTSNFQGAATAATTPSDDEPNGITTTTPVITTNTQTPNVPVATTPVEITTSELQLNQSCDKPVQLLMAQVKASFPKRQKCAFNVDPNKAPIEGFIQAREVSNAILKLPENSEICAMTLESPAEAKLKYDDFIVLTIDDFVIFASNKEMVGKLGQVNGLYKWDFLKVRESKILNFMEASYCIGAAERCKFPGTDTEGSVLMKLNYTEIAGITKAIQGKAQVPIQLVATGDNDDSADKMDCYHEALDLTITMNYIKKPK